MSKSKRFDKRKKTITRTFRIRQEWDEVLQKEASRQGVSVNVLLNKILRKYTLYSRWNDKSNTITLPQRSLYEILNNIEMEKISEIGSNRGVLDVINLVNSMGLKMDYSSFIFLMTEYFGGSEFARWFKCFHHKQGNKDIFHLQHSFGRNWSIFLEKYFISFLKSMVNTEFQIRIYDYAITLELNRPKSNP